MSNGNWTCVLPWSFLREFRYAEKAQKTMESALAALDEGRIDVAEKELEQACVECQIGKFRRAALVDMIISWGLTGSRLREAGQRDLGEDCLSVARCLICRLENGEFREDDPS
jgi:hypothetical protein